MRTLSASSLIGLGALSRGDDLAGLIVSCATSQTPPIQITAGHLVAVAHKAISKVEGAVVSLQQIEPSQQARKLAERHGKDPRVVQVVLDQSDELLRAERGVLICRTHHGFVCANAGVDSSNADPGTVVTLPVDPDASARRLRSELARLTGAAPGVLITDSFGRAWRNGQCDVAVGCAGLAPLDDWRGRVDAGGQPLNATWLAVADAAAATADLARRKDSQEPVVLIDGLAEFLTVQDGPGARALIRSPGEDLFR